MTHSVVYLSMVFDPISPHRLAKVSDMIIFQLSGFSQHKLERTVLKTIVRSAKNVQKVSVRLLVL